MNSYHTEITHTPLYSTAAQVHNAQDLARVMELGSKNRSVGATLMNVDSSRSHSIFTIDIEMVREGGAEAGLRAGRLNLVDLAGSERQSKTGSTGDRLKEATKINLSLSALGNVISGQICLSLSYLSLTCTKTCAYTHSLTHTLFLFSLSHTFTLCTSTTYVCLSYCPSFSLLF